MFKTSLTMLRRNIPFIGTNYMSSLKMLNKIIWEVVNTILQKKNNTSIISNIMTNIGKTNDPNRITEAFNDYFINVGPSLASKIENDSNISFSQFYVS